MVAATGRLTLREQVQALERVYQSELQQNDISGSQYVLGLGKLAKNMASQHELHESDLMIAKDQLAILSSQIALMGNHIAELRRAADDSAVEMKGF